MTATFGTIGFIGIGAMGTPMATNLAKNGHRLVVYDTDPSRTAALASTLEVEVARDLDELGGKSDTVVTMLPDGRIVRKVLCGNADGFAECVCARLKPGSLVIDMSSSSPMGTRALGEVLKQRGIDFIDAPVSNGVKGATNATLSIMVGGDRALFERCKPLFEKLGKDIFYSGPLGAGHAIKALNNYVSAAGLVAACEAVVAGQRFGLDPNVVVDILNASSGMNNTTKNKVKQHMLSGTFGSNFSTGLMAKDVRTAMELAEAMGGGDVMARHTAAIWNDAETGMGFTSDHTAIFRYLEASAKRGRV